jgi:hypothetical protein
MKGKKMKLVITMLLVVGFGGPHADYARAFECVRDRVRDADYDHIEKFFSPL